MVTALSATRFLPQFKLQSGRSRSVRLFVYNFSDAVMTQVGYHPDLRDALQLERDKAEIAVKFRVTVNQHTPVLTKIIEILSNE
jgi:hypothetical protein